MNLTSKFLLLFALCAPVAYTHSAPDTYKKEFETLKETPEYKNIFDRDAHSGASSLQRDVENYQELSWLQRWMRASMFLHDVMVVTPKTMPKLYAHIRKICDENHVSIPTIFITRRQGVVSFLTEEKMFISSQKILFSSGSIVIGKRLLEELSDAELSAAVAREIAHIKYNHGNKKWALRVISIAAMEALVVGCLIQFNPSNQARLPNEAIMGMFGLAAPAGWYLAKLIVNKRYEKQADAFACNTGNADGLLSLVKQFETIDARPSKDLDKAGEALNEGYPKLGSISYVLFCLHYYRMQFGNGFTSLGRWLKYNLPIYEAQSPEERIKTIKKHMATAQ